MKVNFALHILRPIAPIVKLVVKIYTSHERIFSYKNIIVKVQPGVFHPGLFISTKVLLRFVESLELKDKTFLELGAGTGIISVLAEKKGAIVYASDISNKALKNIKINSEMNNSNIKIINSNLFQNIPQMKFDFIIINPPYYKKKPKVEEDYAWYCGANYEYFYFLFNELENYLSQDSKVYMILSEVSDIKKIKSIGIEHDLNWQLQAKKRVWGEHNFIYKITQSL